MYLQCIDQIGSVHRVTERGDIRVQFDSINQRWTFHPRAIHRLSAFSAGDAVRITDDLAQVKQLQRGHGEWVDVMRSVISSNHHYTSRSRLRYVLSDFKYLFQMKPMTGFGENRKSDKKLR